MSSEEEEELDEGIDELAVNEELGEDKDEIKKTKLMPEDVEEEQPIIVKHLTRDIISSCISTPYRLGYGYAHAFVKLECINKSITDISLLATYVHLRYIRLSQNLITDLSPLSSCEGLLYLKADLNLITSGAQLTPLKYLQFFDLSGNKLVTADVLSHPLLATLNFNDNQITSIMKEPGPYSKQEYLPSLKQLEVRGNQLTSTEGLTNLAHLHTLYAAANRIRTLTDIAHMHGLVRLHLRDNQLKHLDGFSDTMLALEYLNLRGNEIRRMREVKKLAVLPSLKVLVLSDNPVSEADDYRNLVIGNLRNLKKLDKDAISSEELAEAIDYADNREEEEFEEEMEEAVKPERENLEADENEEAVENVDQEEDEEEAEDDASGEDG